MNLILVVKRGGSVAHYKEEGKRWALCGTTYGHRNCGGSGWVPAHLVSTTRVCAQCAAWKENASKLEAMGLQEVK